MSIKNQQSTVINPKVNNQQSPIINPKINDRKRKVILVVEDQALNMELVRDILQVSGYTTLEATDGKQGIELAREKMPNLILMDIRMPVMDGLEATRILKADAGTRDIPIVALTAHAMKGDKENIIQAGCDGYLPKPINIKQLKETVKKYLKD